MSNPHGKPPRKGDATLERWAGERELVHRALLLLAMQGPLDRSNRTTARAISRSEACIRNWRKGYEWDKRIAAYGDEADEVALQMYRRLYAADYGAAELIHVAKRVVRPLGGGGVLDEAAKAQRDAVANVSKTLSGAVHEVETATAQALADHRRDVRQDAERHIKLVDASLGLIARKLKEGEIRVSVRDIPTLLECRQRLTDVVSGAHHEAAAQVVESARLRHAKATGGDVLAALYEDVQELDVLLSAMITSKGADLHALAEADQESRAQGGHE